VDERVEGAVDVRAWLREWTRHSSEWRAEAEDAYNQVAGTGHWADEDMVISEETNRTAVTFNRISALVRGICGLEVNNRQEVRYLPREIGDVQVNEILTAGAKWVRDECNAEDEDSDVFRDMVICGMGFGETWIDYSTDPAGRIMVDRLSPLNCAWDPSAHKRALQDARWIATWKDLDVETVERMWPGKLEEILALSDGSAGGLNLDMSVSKPHDDTGSPWYRSTATSGESVKGKVRVVQVQYWEEVTTYRVSTGMNQTLDLPEKRYREVQQVLESKGLSVKKIKSRVYKQSFISGDVDLSTETLPTDRFTIQAMTGIRDETRGIWYGIVRDLKDPQKWGNKFFSLIIDILKTNAKGGLLAEVNAFLDERSAEEDWANPTKIVWLTAGGLAKVRDRVSNPLPPALPQLMEYANNLIPQTSGVSLEFLGLTDKVQAGVLEYQRRQATIGTLAEFFSSLRLYRKNSGRVLARFIVTYLNDGRLIRLIGPDGEKYVPLLVSPGALDYDVVVDEAPTSPDIKGRTWAALSEILPLAIKQGLPIPPEVLDYSPLPSSLASKWKEMIIKSMNQPRIPEEVQKQLQEMHQAVTDLQQENARLKLSQEAKILAARQNYEQKMAELALEGNTAERKLALMEDIAKLNAQIKALQAEREAQLAEYKVAMDGIIKHREAMANVSLQHEKQTGEQAETIRELEARINNLEAALASEKSATRRKSPTKTRSE
jgi:hypothetical protein